MNFRFYGDKRFNLYMGSIFKGQPLPLKMGPITGPQTSVSKHQPMLRNITEEPRPQSLRPKSDLSQHFLKLFRLFYSPNLFLLTGLTGDIFCD
jgi:hypothetical protein